jgi:prepilin-type N-terminal cleavage/methylation domain-containing protein
MHTPQPDRDGGFTLVEILIAIVLVGILSAVVVVGVGTLTDQGNDSACTASLDASKAGAVVYFAQNGSYPDEFTDMTAASALEPPTDVTVNPNTLEAEGWTLTIAGGGAASKPTFTCS